MYARKNLLKEKLARGELVMGMELWMRDPRIIELLGDAGFDFAHIEYEHVAHDWQAVENLIRTAELAGLTPLFRSEQCFNNQPPVNQIIKALKCGAQIIMVPHVNTPEAARKAVEAIKFPPLGHRGIATCDRSAKEIVPNESVPLDIQRFIQDINEESMVWAIIESPEAVKNIDAILDVEGIDAVGFGHQDYSIAGGLSADSGAEIDEAREKVRKAALRKGKYMWWNTDSVEVVKEQREKGIQIFLMGVDIIYINALLRKLVRETRAA
jgi:2-keto-3-deoxy-L-rhamnonate aldolase RhmA